MCATIWRRLNCCAIKASQPLRCAWVHLELPAACLRLSLAVFLTYARPDNEMGTAPGQLTAQEFMNVYSFARITPATNLFAVVGWPIEHSLSPLLHNAAFSATQFNGAYVPLAIPPEWEHFNASIGELSASAILNLRGISVTLPHKEHALRWCKQQGGVGDVVSEWCGAANTLIFPTTALRTLSTPTRPPRLPRLLPRLA